MSIAPGNQAHAFNPAGFSWQLLQALQFLRVRRVGHRDTSLENPFLSRGVVKVMAFGIASQTYAEDHAPR